MALLPNPPAREPDGRFPEKPLPLWGYLLKNNIEQLIAAGALFLVCSLPVVTLPLAYGGLTAVYHSLSNDKPCAVWRDFWRGFRTSPLLRVSLFLLCAVVTAACFFWPSLLGFRIAGVVFSVCAGGLLSVVFGYAYAQGELLLLSQAAIWKNAVLLTFAYLPKTLLLLALYAIVPLLAYFLFPNAIFTVCLILLPAILLFAYLLQQQQIREKLAIRTPPTE